MNENVTRCKSCFEQYAGVGRCPFCGYDPRKAAADSVALMPGTVLKSRYMVGKVLGQGGFGVTYLAWDNLFKNKVAIKEYLPTNFCTRGRGEKRITAFSGSGGQVFHNGKRRFLEEAQMLAMFQAERAIVSVKDFFEENDTAYYAMEYIDGCTLSKHIKNNGVYSLQETVRLMLSVTECLERIHAKGLLHRDIAPDNIMVTKDGQAKLIDFGSARFASFTTNDKSLTVMVKHGYSAPEQYFTKGERGPFTDVYALGATMYKMLTGISPPESLERKTRIVDGGADPLEPLTKYASDAASLEPVILAAMDVFSARRIQTAKELHDRLADFDPRAAVLRKERREPPLIEDLPPDGSASNVDHSRAKVQSVTETQTEVPTKKVGSDPTQLIDSWGWDIMKDLFGNENRSGTFIPPPVASPSGGRNDSTGSETIYEHVPLPKPDTDYHKPVRTGEKTTYDPVPLPKPDTDYLRPVKLDDSSVKEEKDRGVRLVIGAVLTIIVFAIIVYILSNL